MESGTKKAQGKGKGGVRIVLCLIVLIAIIVYCCVSCFNKDCELCHGDKVCRECCKMGDEPGACWVCDGEGSFEGSFYTPCSECDSTGTCGSCGGTGKCHRCGGSGKE